MKRIFDIELIGLCNAKCPFCPQSFNPNGVQREERFWSEELVVKVMNEIKEIAIEEVKELNAFVKELRKKIDNYKTIVKSHRKEIERLNEEHTKQMYSFHKKLNERISCKDYESEANEYFAHNPNAKNVSFYMLDELEGNGFWSFIKMIWGFLKSITNNWRRGK